MAINLSAATLALYAASLALYVCHLYSDHRAVGRAASLCLAGGVVLQYFSLMARSHWTHTVPYQDLYGSMSLFAWLLAVTYLALELLHGQRSVGPFVLPFVLIFTYLATIEKQMPVSPPPARGPVFALHVTLNILAYSAFALSFVLSLIYLFQNRLLRGRKLGTPFWRFPALEVLERMTRSSVILGMASLAIGIAMGFLYLNRMQGRLWNGDPKEVASLLILASYAAYVWLARRTDWRGPRASILCICSFLFVLFSYTVVNLYLSRYHRYF